MAHNLEIVLKKNEYEALAKNAMYGQWKADSLFEFKDGPFTILVHGAYRDLGTSMSRRELRKVLKMQDPGEAIEKYGTEAYKVKMAKDRDDARNLVRDVAPEDGDPLDPPDIDSNKDAIAATEDLLKNNGGMVLGYDHKDQHTKDLLRDLVKQGTVKHVFIEEFPIELQKDIDDFLSSPAGKLSPALASHISEKKAYKNVDFEPILIAAREKGVKIHGIDSVEADPGVDESDPRYHERRVVMMNAVAKRVFDDVRKKFPKEPFAVGTGLAHVNTVEGGIPGLSQIMGVPGIVLDTKSKKIVHRPEDTSKRGMSSRLESEFVEACLKQVMLDFKTGLENFKKSDAFTKAVPQPATTDKLEKVQVLPVAQQLAKQFVANKKLTDKKNISGLLKDQAVKNAFEPILKATYTRSQNEKDLRAALESGNLATLKTVLDADPYLLHFEYDPTDETNILHAAAKKGHGNLVEELLKRGMDPNATDQHGQTALHIAVSMIPEGKKPSDVAKMVSKLLDGGANPDLRDSQGQSGLTLAKTGPLAGGEVLQPFANSGKVDLKELFVTRFIEDAKKMYKLVWKAPMMQLDPKELQVAGEKIAKKLGDQLNSSDAVTSALKGSDVAKETSRIIDLTKERHIERNKIKGLIDANNVAELNKMFTKDPVLTRVEIDDKTPLALAASKGKFDVVGELITKHGVDVNQVSSKGRTALHDVCTQDSKNADKSKEIAGHALTLISMGANVNAKNRGGQTALHQAALWNNTELIKVLASKGADPEIKDNRGWTAYDVALGSTNKEAEKVFYDQKLATNEPPLVDKKNPNSKVLSSTIDILCQVTLCNDPSQAAEVRKNYETLYADPTMRPMLDIAAAAACNPRNPPKGGLRIFVNNSNTVGPLFGKDVGPSGAYDEKVNSLLIPMGSDGKEKDPIGTLAHELTHLAAHLVTDDENTMPFETEREKKAYLAAIEGDIKKLHLLNGKNEAEQFVLDRFSTRMKGYADRGGDEQLLQEYLVGIPQIAAVYGMEYVEKLVPNLARYFKKFTARCTQVAQTDDRFKNGRERISSDANKAMVQKLDDTNAKPPKTKVREKMEYEQRIKPDSGFLIGEGKNDAEKMKGLIEKVKTDYIAKHGKQKSLTGRTIAYTADDFELTAEQTKSLNSKLAQVEKVLISEIAKGNLPPKVNANSVRTLIGMISDTCHNKDAKDLAEILKNRTGNWVKNEKIGYADAQLAANQKVTPSELAEAIVYRAQAQANGDGDRISRDTSVNQKKQSELVKQLTQSLSKPEAESQLKDPKKLIATMSQSLAKDSNKAIYIKDDKTDHVSIDKRQAKRTWLRKLQKVRG